MPGAKARRHRAVRDHPGPEPAQRARDIQHQPQQPQRQAARQGQRGRPVISQRLAVVAGRASTQARTTPISVSEASAYTAAGITQIARSFHPCPAASAFIASEIPMHAAFSARGPDRPLAVQGQRHAERGENHRAHIRDARLQRRPPPPHA